MNDRLRIYSLIWYSGEWVLTITLTGLLHDYFHHEQTYLQIDLPTGKISLNKYQWINKGRIYDNGEVAFLICTKSFSNTYAEKLLTAHKNKKQKIAA